MAGATVLGAPVHLVCGLVAGGGVLGYSAARIGIGRREERKARQQSEEKKGRWTGWFKSAKKMQKKDARCDVLSF